MEIRNIRRDVADHIKKRETRRRRRHRRSAPPGSRRSRRRRTDASPRSTASARPRSRRSSRSKWPARRWPARPTHRRSRTSGSSDRPAFLPRPEDCRGTSRSSWTATAAGPGSTASPEIEGHAAGVEAIRRDRRARGPPRRPGADALRLQPRELGALRRRGRRACSACSRRRSAARPPSCARRASGSGCSAAWTSCPSETRRSIGEALDATAGGDRLILNIAFNYSGRTELVDAVRRLRRRRHCAPERDRRGAHRRARCTRPACRIPTCSSGPAASNGSPTS